MDETEVLTDFKYRLQALLPRDADLQFHAEVRLNDRLLPTTRRALGMSTLSFFTLPHYGRCALAVLYEGEAILARSQHWENLDDLCETVQQQFGIQEVHVRGSDLYIRCQVEMGKWIRESIP